jgi:hypothetical protein
MQYLLEFDQYEPDPNETNFWQNYVRDNYPVKMQDGMKFIIIDEKPVYITGYLANKGRAIQKIFNDINYNHQGDIHEPSLRRGIKFWYDEQDYIQI